MAVDKLVDSGQLDSDLEDIADAIRTKGGTSAQLEFPQDFITAIGNIPSGGGGGGEAEELGDVVFIDYDGTVLYSYSFSEAANLVSLPTAPSHSGLTFQEWNFTLAEVKAATRQLVVGANYITTDGKTKLYLTFLSAEDDDVGLAIYINTAGSVTIDWGDGTTETPTGTGIKKINHAYSHETYPATAVISITVSTSGGAELGGNLNGILTANGNTSKALRKVEMGENITWINSAAFAYSPYFETISISAACKDLSSAQVSGGQLQSAWANAVANPKVAAIRLKAIVLPRICQTSSTRRNEVVYGCTGLKAFSGAKNISADYFSGAVQLKLLGYKNSAATTTAYKLENLSSLLRFDFPTNITTLTNGQFAYDYNLRKVMLPSGITKIPQTAFDACVSLETLTIPLSVTTIENYALRGLNNLKELHMLPTSPPTLGTVSLTKIFKLFVPYSADHSVLNAYKTATNWSEFADQMVEEPQ